MSEFDFKSLIGKKVSLMLKFKKPTIRNQRQGNESYVGILKIVYDNFLVLNITKNPRGDLSELIVVKDYVKSIWVYKTSKRKKGLHTSKERKKVKGSK